MRRKQASKKPRPLKDQEDKASEKKKEVCEACIPSSHRTQKAYFFFLFRSQYLLFSIPKTNYVKPNKASLEVCSAWLSIGYAL